MPDSKLPPPPDGAALDFLVLDLLEQILSYAENPGQLGTYLTQQLRELIGGRIVALWQTPSALGLEQPRWLSIAPERYRTWEQLPALEALAAACDQHGQPAFWEAASAPPAAQAALAALDCPSTITLPLHAGAEHMGVLLVLHLLDLPGSDKVLRALQVMAPVVGLILRNARFYEEQEQTIAHRTQDLAESEQRYRHLTELSPDAIMIYQAERFVYANPAALALFGATQPTDLLGHPILERIHPALRAEIAQRLHRIGERPTGAPFLELQILRLDGQVINIEAVGQPFRYLEQPAVQVIARDITSRKQAEEKVQALNASLERRVAERTAELSAANASLERALQARDEFLATTSHELRTPLTGVLGLAENLQLGLYGPLTDKQHQALGTLRESGQHLLDLINDILDVAKMEAEAVALELTPVAVAELCKASLRLVRDQAQKKRIKVTLTTDLAFDSLHADERRLKQVLVNLLNNAVKFTPDGGQMGLAVSGDAERQVIYFDVWDTGIGITPEVQAQLFQPFVQGDRRLARQYEGAGLGLALVRRLVDLHGGSVSLESTPGQGSRFRVALPWQPEAESLAPAAAPPLPAFWAAPLPAGLDLLLADDNAVFTTLAADALRQLGCAVRVAGNGQAAVDEVRLKPPDLILMDIQMPVLSGLEAIRRIRALDGGTALPIIALTALAMKGDREACLAAGADEYLAKPVALAEMMAAIARHVPPAHSPGSQPAAPSPPDAG